MQVEGSGGVREECVTVPSTYLDLNACGIIEGDPSGVGEGVGCGEVLVPLHRHVVISDHLAYL